VDDRFVRHERLSGLLASSNLAQPFGGAVLVAGARAALAVLGGIQRMTIKEEGK